MHQEPQEEEPLNDADWRRWNNFVAKFTMNKIELVWKIISWVYRVCVWGCEWG